jgi:hypothetical protein
MKADDGDQTDQSCGEYQVKNIVERLAPEQKVHGDDGERLVVEIFESAVGQSGVDLENL